LILILSLISLSAGSGNGTEKHENAGIDPVSKTVTDNDAQRIENTEDTEKDLETEEETGTGTDDQKTGSPGHEENLKESISTNNQESSEETQKTVSDSEDGTDDQESAEEDLKSKEGIEDSTEDSTETATEKDTGTQEILEKSTEIETETEQDADNQENLEENSEIKEVDEEVEDGSTDNQKSSEENLVTTTETEQDVDDQGSTEENEEVQDEVNEDTDVHEDTEKNEEVQIGVNEDTGSQGSTEENEEVQTGSKDDTGSQVSTEENSETEIKTERIADSQENSKKSQEAGKAESCSTDNLKSSCKSTSKEEETEENSDSTEKSDVNPILKTCEDNKKDCSDCSGTKTEMKTGSCDDSQNPGAVEVETEGATNSGETDQISDDTETQINSEGSNQSYITGSNESKITGNNESKSDEADESSWNNLQYILSHSGTLRSFYTTNESVKITYKGPEDLKDQKVDIYLVKTRNSIFSEKAFKNITDGGTISFEDIFSENLESYIQIPATLNGDGDLSPLPLGPLPEGSYWVVVTLAKNETEAHDSEKTILLVHCFKVLEYEMRARVPNTLDEGENFEVNLNMKNAPTQKNYTFCAVLMREDAFGTNTNISSDTSGTKSMSLAFAKGFRLIEYFGLNATDYGSETGKEKLTNEIQDLIGEGNGTVCIGEENQNTLSLRASDLPPGNYLLFAGACEKGRDLAGMAQTEVSIGEAKKSNPNLSIESQSSSNLETGKPVYTAGSFGLESLEPQIRGEALKEAEVIRTPSKPGSFLIGFVGTLLIGIAILSRRR
jgi:methanogen extracellular protein (TIGR04279 family)